MPGAREEEDEDEDDDDAVADKDSMVIDRSIAICNGESSTPSSNSHARRYVLLRSTVISSPIFSRRSVHTSIIALSFGLVMLR